MVFERRSVGVLCLGAAMIFAAATSTHADAVADWNQTAIRATEIAGAAVPVQTRVMSLVHAAMFDAVNAIEKKYTTYAVEAQAAPGASADVAAAVAAHDILERLYPLQKPIIDAALTASLKSIPDGAAKTEGVRLGQEVAEKLLALRKDDGSAAQVAYNFGSGPGVYQATPPMNANPILPQWRNLKPFVITGPKQFAFGGPPAVTSAAFAKDFNEVKNLGSRTSIQRTNEQTAIAIHWAGSEVPPLNAVARTVATAKGLDLIDSVRLFALLNMAMADSLIAGFEAKYSFNFWRPITAIRNAGMANNAEISADPNWEPLLVTPPHQEYPSAHCLGTGAAVAVLQEVFGSDNLVTSYVYPPLGVARRWESFSQIAKEVENARIWGGIHYRTAVDHGTQIGRQVGEFALKTQMRLRTE